MFFARACTCPDDTGSGNVATASSKALVIIAMVSGLNDVP